MNYKFLMSISLCLITIIFSSCQTTEPRIVYITATPDTVPPFFETAEIDVQPTNTAVASPAFDVPSDDDSQSYIVQIGDTLSGIALEFGTTVDVLLQINGIVNPDVIEVGQVIDLPPKVTQKTSDTMLLVNSRFIPGSQERLAVREFINTHGGAFIKQYNEEVIQRSANSTPIAYTLDAAEIIEAIAVDFSLDARLLLTLLEYRSQFVSADQLDESNEQFPLISDEDSNVNRSGLYRQLSWAANELNRGYYTARYSNKQQILEFTDGTRILLNTELNAATSALQYFFSLNNSYNQWVNDLDSGGFIETYRAYFGDPLEGNDAIIPNQLSQPVMQLPFEVDDIWYFTGGAHGGWGNGSTWSAIDFAPPDNNNLLCYVSAYWITAVADGVIARSEGGTVILDLDGDGNELTGWNIVYLHVASQDRIGSGVMVKKGDRIGHASCEGGFSTATHLHIARKYNGEWIPANCSECNSKGVKITSFTMSGWSVVSIPNQEYQGYLINSSGETRTAEQGRDTPINQIQLEDSA